MLDKHIPLLPEGGADKLTLVPRPCFCDTLSALIADSIGEAAPRSLQAEPGENGGPFLCLLSLVRLAVIRFHAAGIATTVLLLMGNSPLDVDRPAKEGGRRNWHGHGEGHAGGEEGEERPRCLSVA